MNGIASFLQTERWAAFQGSLGRKVFRIDGGQWNAVLMRHDLPLGSHYLYCPRGPIVQHGIWSAEHGGDSVLSEFMLEVASIAQQEKSVFLRWDPGNGITEQDISVVRRSSFEIRQAHPVQPRRTVVLDLAQSNDLLISHMHEKTRYNVRLAERKGVRVREVPGPDGLGIFWSLLGETTERDEFSAHPKEHYAALLSVFSECVANAPTARLYVAELGGTPLAAAIVMYHEGIATYLHGASSNTHRNSMGPYLLHWRIMEDAKALGMQAYDLWGVDDENPRWAGITRFKRGFGGSEFSFAPSMDILFRPWAYTAYSLARRLVR